MIEQNFHSFEASASHSPIERLSVNRYFLKIGTFRDQVVKQINVIVIGCKVKGRNFSFFSLVGGILQLLHKVLDNIEMAVLNGRKKRRISLLVLGGVSHSNSFDEMLDDIEISPCNCKVKWHFSLSFFDSIK